jgi:hypothetical protein
MYIEDVIVHLSSDAGPRVGHLGVATIRGGEQIPRVGQRRRPHPVREPSRSTAHRLGTGSREPRH